MHFKHNRRAAQSAGRGHSRASFLGVDDWIHNNSGNDKGKDRAISAIQSDGVPPAPSVAELRSRYVVVPAGDEAKRISCPICKEQLKSEFLEDDEEWVWRNAVMKDDKVRSSSAFSIQHLTHCLSVDISCNLPCRGIIFNKSSCPAAKRSWIWEPWWYTGG
jgi:hypothetical protein